MDSDGDGVDDPNVVFRNTVTQQVIDNIKTAVD